MVQDRKEGAETTKTPVQSVSSVILSTYVLSLKVIFRRVKGVLRDPLKFSHWDSVTPEAHCIAVIPVVALVVEALDQISDYPKEDGIGSSAPGGHQQSR